LYKKLPAAAAVDEEVDGEVEEVDELEQFLPGELAARRLHAAADQVVDHRLDVVDEPNNASPLILHFRDSRELFRLVLLSSDLGPGLGLE